MKICIVGKFPPIQGGVSTQTYWTANELVGRGHEVHVVTNAQETEFGIRQLILPNEEEKLGGWVNANTIHRHETSILRERSYIPWSNPYLSKLLGITLDVIERHGADLIYGFYFEPYGVVATLAGMITGRPVVIRHAGSDLGRLAKHPDLVSTYRWMISNSNVVITTKNTKDLIISLGARCQNLHIVGVSQLPEIYRSAAEKGYSFNLDEYCPILEEWYKRYPLSGSTILGLTKLNNKTINPELPTIGLYGKIGETKGSYDFIGALKLLTEKGILFNFIVLASGSVIQIEKFSKAILEHRQLAQVSWILPPLPPWRIPGFLAQCAITCFLENNFPISFHAPRVPREILASGSCLVCSEEIISKQSLGKNLVNGKNCIIIPNPKDHIDLAKKLEDLIIHPQATLSIGKHGLYLSRFWENQLPADQIADALEKISK